jgi:NAD(P)-dependent dehydrogenase (short-subunit alcohol dehydrogenase family)
MKGKRVLITGACGDIGSGLASGFAGMGAQLALCDLWLAEEAGRHFKALKERGGKVFYQRADVTSGAEMNGFVRAAAGELGGIDVCIANAGIVERGPLLDLSAEAWRKTLDVNLTGAFLTAQAAGREMVARKTAGQIIFISSWVQDVPRENIGGYCASKGGLKMLARAMALELGPVGIRVNLIAPGFVDAGLTAEYLRANPERRAKIEGEIPLGKLISTEELVRSVRLLCSEDAAYMTGTTLLVDGGASLFYRKS